MKSKPRPRDVTPSGNGHRKRLRILLVDDDPDTLECIRLLLSGAFPQVEIVTMDGPIRALKWLGAKSVDLILTDYHMPDLDGVSLVERARRLHPKTRALLVTGDPRLESRSEEVRGLGVAEVILKPVNPTGLIAAVLRHLKAGLEWPVGRSGVDGKSSPQLA